jgi:hypothetical protein
VPARVSAFDEENVSRERLERAVTLSHGPRTQERMNDASRITPGINALDKRRQRRPTAMQGQRPWCALRIRVMFIRVPMREHMR